GEKTGVRLEARVSGGAFSHDLDPLAPWPETWDEAWSWYLTAYLFDRSENAFERARSLTGMLNDQSDALMENLFKHDYVEDTLLFELEETEWKDIRVIVQSNRPEFHRRPWEIMALPASPRYPATAGAGFIRTAGVYDEKPSTIETGPLRILLVSTRPRMTLALVNAALQSENAIRLETLAAATPEGLAERLKADPVHAVHVDGPIDFGDWIEVLAASPVETVFAEVADHDKVGPAFLQAGLRNLIVIGAETHRFVARDFFSTLYSQWVAAGSLERAVVQTRALMKQANHTQRLSGREKEFNHWPVVVHYGRGDVVLCVEPQEPKGLKDTGAYADVRKGLIGFYDDLLPPNPLYGRDEELHQIQEGLYRNQPLVVLGGSGTGKTHFAHGLAYIGVALGAIEQAFFFDFERHPFSKDQILLNLREVWETSDEDVLVRLRESRCLLIFDDFRMDGDEADYRAFFDTVHQGESRILVTGVIPVIEGERTEMSLNGLGREERRQCAVDALRKRKREKKDADPDFDGVLDAVDGHPLLTRALPRWLERLSGSEILASLAVPENLWTCDGREVLYRFGWNHLPEPWRPLYAAFADLLGFPLDMLSPLLDRKSPATAEFFDGLNLSEPPSMPELLKAGVVAGFLIEGAAAREVSWDARFYLRAMQDELAWSESFAKSNACGSAAC
ncbi:MAG: hypothetical protein AAF492_05850, partial [Verrucomicrobiota bacterium]